MHKKGNYFLIIILPNVRYATIETVIPHSFSLHNWGISDRCSKELKKIVP
jgi:hypothetical protein